MDLLTHGLVGAALAQSGAPREEVRMAAGVGFLAGMLADADALITSANDPLLVLEYHRHFTHSLLFIPAGALIAAAVLWPFMRRRLPFARLYLYTLLGYALAGLLDACTSYGTHLLWPFSEERQALSIIAVVDPLMTLAIGIPFAVGVIRRQPVAARIGLALGVCYLALGYAQHERAESAALGLARERGHEARQLLVKPTIANLVLWRSTYVEGGRIHADGIRAVSSQKVLFQAGNLSVMAPSPRG